MLSVRMFLISALLALPQDGPAIGSSISINDIRVTLLNAKRLSFEEYRDARSPATTAWNGGGFRFAFLVENRPGAPLPPAIGDVRVLLGGKLYNPVTNASSQKPFAPLIVIRDADDFFITEYGVAMKFRAPLRRQETLAVVEDVFIPGIPVEAGTSGQVEFEQGETYRRSSRGELRQLTPAEMAQTWTSFRFSFSALD